MIKDISPKASPGVNVLNFCNSFYYFFFQSKPGDIYRIIFFIFVALGALSYFIFNKCFFTSIELKLSEEKNLIQIIVEEYFGEEIEGNIISKIVLSLLSIIAGIILLKELENKQMDIVTVVIVIVIITANNILLEKV